MNSREYYAGVQKAILAAPHVIQTDISFDEISEEECYIRGVLTLNGGFELHIAEYVVTEPEFKRLKYRFHLQTSDSKMLVRWDNAPHHPEIKTHPDHLHLGDKIKANPPVDISPPVLFNDSQSEIPAKVTKYYSHRPPMLCPA